MTIALLHKHFSLAQECAFAMIFLVTSIVILWVRITGGTERARPVKQLNCKSWCSVKANESTTNKNLTPPKCTQCEHLTLFLTLSDVLLLCCVLHYCWQNFTDFNFLMKTTFKYNQSQCRWNKSLCHFVYLLISLKGEKRNY